MAAHSLYYKQHNILCFFSTYIICALYPYIPFLYFVLSPSQCVCTSKVQIQHFALSINPSPPPPSRDFCPVTFGIVVWAVIFTSATLGSYVWTSLQDEQLTHEGGIHGVSSVEDEILDSASVSELKNWYWAVSSYNIKVSKAPIWKPVRSAWWLVSKKFMLISAVKGGENCPLKLTVTPLNQ